MFVLKLNRGVSLDMGVYVKDGSPLFRLKIWGTPEQVQNSVRWLMNEFCG